MSATQNPLTFALVMRIAGLTIGAWDYVWTLPYEISLLFNQTSFWPPSRCFLLFFGNRYIAIAVVVISNVGYFKTDFSASECDRYHRVAPTLKICLDIMAQTILALRTYALSRKAPWVKYTLFFILPIVTMVGLVVNTIYIIPTQGGVPGIYRCNSANSPGYHLVWLNYLFDFFYDFYCLVTSTSYLILHSAGPFEFGKFTRMLLEQGIVYFMALTAVNVLNVVCWNLPDVTQQSAGVTFCCVITWIMAQRILLDLISHMEKRVPGGSGLPFSLPTPVAVKSISQNRSGPKGSTKSGNNTSFFGNADANELELGGVHVHVQVENNHTLSGRRREHDFDMYSIDDGDRKEKL